MMRYLPALSLALSGPALAAPLSYEDAQRMALEANPSVLTAKRSVEQTEFDILSARGGFDPSLMVNGGWSQATNVQTFQTVVRDAEGNFVFDENGLPAQQTILLPVLENGWNLSTNLSATTASGTSATLSGVLAQRAIVARETGTLQGSFIVPNFSLTVGQELLRGVKLSYNLQNVRQAQESKSIATLELTKASQQVLADLADAYWSWVYQVKLAEISEIATEIAVEDLRIGIAKVEAGEAAPVERTRLEAALVQAQSAAIDAQNAAAQAADRVLLLLGRQPGEAIEPASEPGDAASLSLDPETVTATTLASSIDLAVAERQLDAAKARLADARHNMWPSLRANVDAGLSGSGQSFSQAFTLDDGLFPTIGLSGMLQVPLGNRAARGRSQRAAVDVAERQAALENLRRQITAQVQQQVRLLVSAKRKVDLADANLRFAQETLAAEQALYEAGRSLLKDVLESRNQVDRAMADAAKSRTDYRVAEAELLRLQGKLDIRSEP